MLPGPRSFARLSRFWAEVYRDWLPITDRWANAAEMIAAAIEGEGRERGALLAEPSFANTHCRLLIERRRRASGQGEKAG